MIVVNNKYDIGDIVYLKTDEDQSPRVVTCIKVFKHGELNYELAHGTIVSLHYEFEISNEKEIANI